MNIIQSIAPFTMGLAALCTGLPSQATRTASNENEFQQALSTSAPGDRIELTSNILNFNGITIPTSVTITSAPNTRWSISASGLRPSLLVVGLDPAIPLVFENVDLTAFEMSESVSILTTQAPLPGSVWLRDVAVQYNTSQYGEVTVIDLDVDELRMDSTSVVAQPLQTNFACFDLNGKFGVSCVGFRGQRLLIQDSTLTASDGIYLLMHPTGCFAGTGIEWTGGDGGTALDAVCPLTVITSSELTDGHGSSYEAGNWMQWGSTPVPGAPGVSQFGTTVIAHASTHRQGTTGIIGAQPGPPMGVPLGDPVLRLLMPSDVRLGDTVSVSTIRPIQAPALLILGVEWGPTLVLQNLLACNLSTALAIPMTLPSTVTFTVPSVPALRGVTLIAQTGYLASGQWSATNPRSFRIR